MINGAHTILYSTNPDADRDFFRNILELPNVDVGGGWLIFALPPAEIAVHPGDQNDVHQLYLLCDDVEALIGKLSARGITCGPVQTQRWGLVTDVTLPGGGTIGIYQPLHARPTAATPTKKPVKGAAKKKAAVKKKPIAKKAPPKKKAGKAPVKKGRR